MKIPAQAKKAFQGEFFSVWQWEQKMYDGSVKIFERVKRPDTVVVIPVVGDKIWINLQEQPDRGEPFLSYFGGQIDPGEEPLPAARRELLEEAGLVSDDWDHYKSYEPTVKVDWTIHYYIARDCRKVAEQSLDNGEKIEIKPVSFLEFFDFAASRYGTSGAFGLDLLKMKLEGKLEEFKKKLWA